MRANHTYAVTTTGEAKKFEYDANGNLRYEKQPNGTVIREYRWDQQNRLVRFLQGTHESVYEYDGESHRVRIKELTSSVETKNETFVWCGRPGRICQKRNSSGVVRSYFGEGFEEASSDYFYTRDHLWSVREVVAGNGTTISSRVTYDPWGKLTESGSVFTDFAFTGHLHDRSAEISLAPARGYDARIGRWLSQDPIGFQGGLNLYGYLANDPLNWTDSTGNGPDTLCNPSGMFGGILRGWLEEAICRPPPPPSPPEPPGPGPGPGSPAPGDPGGGFPGMCKNDDPPKDCAAKCDHLLGPGKAFWGNDGHFYKNDLLGNKQYAFQRCFDECEGKY